MTPTPDFIRDLRAHVGHTELWLLGASAYVLREHPERPGVRQVLLARPTPEEPWGTIGGINDPGEDAATTMVRECREEAGVEVEVERLLWHRAVEPFTYPNGDACRFLVDTVVARWTGGEARVADEENVDVRWFDEDALPEMHGDAEIGWRLVLLDRPEAVLGYAGARALLGADLVDSLLAG